MGFFLIMVLFFCRTLIPILHQKAKRGTPHQAKQAVHCIHAIFTNKEVQLAQIFEVYIYIYIQDVFMLIFILMLCGLLKMEGKFFFGYLVSPQYIYSMGAGTLFFQHCIHKLYIRLYVQILHLEEYFVCLCQNILIFTLLARWSTYPQKVLVDNFEPPSLKYLSTLPEN